MPRTRFASILRANLVGLPTMTKIITAEFDHLRDEGEGLPIGCAPQGVTRLREGAIAGMIHGFAGMPHFNVSRESRVASRDVAADMKAAQPVQASRVMHLTRVGARSSSKHFEQTRRAHPRRRRTW